jgi:sec-independent protein translocase protein TatB
LDLFEIVLILAIALIVVGPERLPEVMRTVGKVLRELRLASNTVLHELTDVLDEPRPSAPPANIPPATTAAASAPKSEPPATEPPAAVQTENK